MFNKDVDISLAKTVSLYLMLHVHLLPTFTTEAELLLTE